MQQRGRYIEGRRLRKGKVEQHEVAWDHRKLSALAAV